MILLFTFQSLKHKAANLEDKDYNSKVAYYLNCIFWVLNTEYCGMEKLDNWRSLFKCLVSRAIHKIYPDSDDVKEIYIPKDCDLVQQTLFFLQAVSPIAFHCMSGQHRLNAIKLLMTGYKLQTSKHTNSSDILYQKCADWRKQIYGNMDWKEEIVVEGQTWNPNNFGKLVILSSRFKVDLHFADEKFDCEGAVKKAKQKSIDIQTTEAMQTQNNIADL